MEISVIKLGPGDSAKFGELLDVFAAVFEMNGFIQPPPDYLEKLLLQDGLTVLTAIYQGSVVGGLTAYTLASVYSPSAEMYIYDLAIKTSFQRKGAGSLLLKELKDHCRRAGIKEIFVQADRPDQHAIDFYTKNGGSAEDVLHFSFPV